MGLEECLVRLHGNAYASSESLEFAARDKDRNRLPAARSIRPQHRLRPDRRFEEVWFALPRLNIFFATSLKCTSRCTSWQNRAWRVPGYIAGGARHNRRRREGDSGQNAEPSAPGEDHAGSERHGTEQQTLATRFAAPSAGAFNAAAASGVAASLFAGSGARGQPRPYARGAKVADLKVGTTAAAYAVRVSVMPREQPSARREGRGRPCSHRRSGGRGMSTDRKYRR